MVNTSDDLLDLLTQLRAANRRVTTAATIEAAEVRKFIKTAPLPGITVRSLRIDPVGTITVTVSAQVEAVGPFGTITRTPQAQGSIAAISTAAPTQKVTVEVAS